MRKLALGLAVVFSSFTANSLAALPTGASSRCEVSVPSYSGGFTFGLTGLYWRASSPEDSFATTFGSDIGLTGSGPATIQNYRHRFDWGFKANIGYVFPCSGNDVNLIYTHWNHTHNESTNGFILPSIGALAVLATTGPRLLFQDGNLATLPIATLLASPDFDVTSVSTVASAQSEFKNQTWDLDFGQAMNIGCNFRLRWFGGLRYSFLENKQDSTVGTVVIGTGDVVVPGTELVPDDPDEVFGGTITFSPITIDAAIQEILNNKSQFNGIGPRFGFDANYHLGCGFGVVGSLSAALLVGEAKSTFCDDILVSGEVTDFAVSQNSITVNGLPAGALTDIFPFTSNDIISFRSPNETRVVPNLEAKLGLDWTYQFCNCSRTRLTIEAGYLISHYFNPIDRLSDALIFQPELNARHTIDVSYDGPYINVRVAV